MEKVTIKEVEYPVSFGMSVIRRFSSKNGLKTVNDFERVVAAEGDITFDQMDKVMDLLLLAIQRGCEIDKLECKLSIDDMYDLLTEAPHEFEKLREIMIGSIAGTVSPIEGQYVKGEASAQESQES